MHNTVKLLITKSNKHFYVQLLCQNTGKIVLSASTLEKKFFNKNKYASNNVVDKLAVLFVQRAVDMGLNSVVYNKNKYCYRGKVKTFLDKVRSEGLVFGKEIRFL